MIKRFEGYRRKAAQLPDGRWTLGYGHTQTARAGAEVSEEDAEALLLYDLIGIAHAVNELTLAPLNRNQFDALSAFVFNIGVESFRGSVVLRRLNEGATLQAAACMEMWRKADFQGERIVVDALVRRRAAEKLLFLTPIDGWVPAPTPVLPPKVDYDAIEALSLQTPSNLTVLLEGERTLARQDDPPAPEPGTASERASAAVGARLQQILSEPEPEVGPVLRLTPATEFDFEPDAEQGAAEELPVGQDGPTLFDVAPPPALPAVNSAAAERLVLEEVAASRAKGWGAALAPIALAVSGMALSGGALFWGFYAQGFSSPVDPRVVSWVGGLAGVSMMAFAAYLALRRLGGSDEP